MVQLGEDPKPRSDGGPVRGEKPYLGFHQGLVDYEDNQVVRANTRIPYASTLVQFDDEEDVEVDNKDVLKLEQRHVPLNFDFVGLKDDDVSKMESLEDTSSIPINFRLVHIATEDGELMMKEQI